LNEGDFVTVIGGNGAGKSTLLNAIAGVWQVDDGSITIGGVDVTHLPEHKRAKYIGRVFQDPMMGTAPTMQIEENLALAKRRGQQRTLRTGITKEEREEYRELLKILDLGLENRLTSKVGLLSGGQRQIFLDLHGGGGAHHGVLEHPADVLRPLVLRQMGHVHPAHGDGALVHRPHPGDGVEEGGLARAVAADDGDEVPLVQVERHPIQGGFFVHGAGVEGLIDIFHVKHGHSPPS
jgi:hypothetical protein